MSYILDALRRADAERERGAVPGLQSQQHAVIDDDARPAPRWPVWAIAALSLALVVAIAWNFIGGELPRSRPVDGGAIATTPTPTQTPSPPPTATVAPAVTPAAPPATTPPAIVATPAVVPTPAASTTTTTTAAATPAKRPTAAAAPRRVATTASTAAPASSSRPAGDDRVYAFSELPDAVRRDLPRLAFGGSSYSGSAASRMVILNGQVFHEGDTVAPGLTLRQIRLKTALLSYKEYRFELSY